MPVISSSFLKDLSCSRVRPEVLVTGSLDNGDIIYNLIMHQESVYL